MFSCIRFVFCLYLAVFGCSVVFGYRSVIIRRYFFFGCGLPAMGFESELLRLAVVSCLFLLYFSSIFWFCCVFSGNGIVHNNPINHVSFDPGFRNWMVYRH